MQTGDREPSFGRSLAELRAARRLSQLKLSLVAGISARHLSFIETGRATPSREMVLRLCGALKLAADEKDALLLAAGFAPARRAPRPLHACGRPDADLIDKVIGLGSAETEETALDIAAGVLGAVGLTHFFTGTIVPAAPRRPMSIELGNTSRALIGWLARCREQEYRNDCPFTRAAASGHRPFFWDDILRKKAQLNPRERQIMGEATEYRVRSGFVMPVRLGDGRVRAVSATGYMVDVDNPRAALAARLIATALLERLEWFEMPAGGRDPRPRLEPREAEFLRLATSGRDAEWIAERFKLPVNEVETVLDRTCARLGASDLNQAMMRARRHGLVEFA